MKATRRLLCLMLGVVGACLPLTGTSASDRGIGGTGAPSTGSPATGPAIADRGIGGTGIVGTITGFGSVFVNGLEVAYTPATPVTVDGVPDPDTALRVGQLAAITANDDHGLNAVSIDVRHEVSGPVTSVSPGDGAGGSMVVVAGQRVAIDSGTEGLRTVNPGDWVSVSGLRGPDGVIAASRVDERTPGTVLVRGPATQAFRGWRIGDLPVQPPNGANVAPGASITARGILVSGRLTAATADPDVLSSDPAAFFGGHVQRMVIESYVSASDGHVRLGRGWLAVPAQGVVVAGGAHRAIVELERGAHGDFVATHLRGPARPFAPRFQRFGPDRRGSMGLPHAGPRPFGPGRFQPRPWRDGRFRRRPG
jgi:hypothetical protein